MLNLYPVKWVFTYKPLLGVEVPSRQRIYQFEVGTDLVFFHLVKGCDIDELPVAYHSIARFRGNGLQMYSLLPGAA